MDELKKILQEKLKVKSGGESIANGKSEEEYFLDFYNKLKLDKSEVDESSYSKIPKFYFKVPKEEEVLPHKLREDARAMFLQTRSRQLLDNNELKALWLLLDKNHSPPTSGDEQMINYENFCKVAKLVGQKCRNYFKPAVFAKLQQDDAQGRISIMALFNYVMRKVWLHQTRIGLSLYDDTGHGYLRESSNFTQHSNHAVSDNERFKGTINEKPEVLASAANRKYSFGKYFVERILVPFVQWQDLENYIQDLIPTLPQLDGLEKSFHSFYVCTAVRKFLFFLDPLRTGRVRIQDILACSFLDDLLELRDEELPKDQQEANWFSAPSALRVYGQYLNLDKDHNGMLSKEELAGYGTGTLTKVFLERVFQECLTYDGEMDYKTYLDFVLALENRHEPQSLHYLFRILDIKNQGYLDTFCLNYFFRAIQEQMSQHEQNPVSFQDVKDEMFDMIKPVDPTKITLQDLLNSGQGETLVSILIDLNGFWTYENREAMAAETTESPSEV